tara:strand:- start:14582 stop:15121 length:540 start_codon:yes stop_codon:yes gene_type:complete
MKKTTTLLFVLCLLTIKLFGQMKQSDMKSQLVILESPTTFAKMLEPLKGKVIYIDIMASFCKPCFSELETIKELESYYKMNNIEKLFISLDNPKDTPKCIKAIESNNIKGYFTSLHSEQEKESSFGGEILKLFFTDKDGNVNLSIPKYGIVNKQGVLVVKNAARPSNTDALKKQLEEWK